MIKVNELKVGNLLNWEADSVGAGISKVINVSEIGFKIKSLSGCAPTLDEYNHITPIPLTPEWLERCGLEQKPPESDGCLQWWNSYMTIAKIDDGYYLYATCTDPWHDQAIGRKIECVHQLQNISLDLFGEELKVEL